MLTEEQIEKILQQIQNSGITNKGLQNDLLDHFCCFIEERIDEGEDFETAYHHAFLAITPNGMAEIEEELFFLMTFKKQTNMKRLLYATGFLAAFFISLGLMFTLFHWLGANVILGAGYIMLLISAVMLLLSALKNIKNERVSYRLRLISGFLAAFFISTGSLFKVMYFPTANMQILVGVVILAFVFLPMFFYRQYKRALAN